MFYNKGKRLPQEEVRYLKLVLPNLLHIVSRSLPVNFVDIHYQWKEISYILKCGI